MSIQNLIEEAFPDEDIPFLTPLDIERRKIIIKRLYENADASEGGGVISYEPIKEVPWLVQQRNKLRPTPCFIKPKRAKKKKLSQISSHQVS
jgi:hypothetical protein